MNFLTLQMKLKQALSIFVLLLTQYILYSQNGITNIYGDSGGFFTSSVTAKSTYNDSNNLLAFSSGGTIFSTGVNDALLTSNNISFVPGEFLALPIPGNISYKNEELVGIGANWGGVQQSNSSTDYIRSFKPIVPSHFLRDGKRGLELSTNFFNIKAQVVKYDAIIINHATSVNDAIPDILVTQTGSPGANDKFKFIDVNGNIVGNELAVTFSNVSAVGGTDWTIYRINPVTGNVNGAFGVNTYRDLRAISFKLSDFGITTTNYNQITNFVHTTSGNTDIAFTAYNENSLKVELPDTDIAVSTNFTTSSPSFCNATTIEFSTVITNNSSNLAKDFEVDAVLPDGITYSSSSATFSIPNVPISNATYDSSRDKWTIIELAPGASVNLKVNGTINTIKRNLSYTATATPLLQVDTNTTNNTATISKNSTLDSDCDGLTDDVDLDDDNDGILDTDELIAPTSRVLNYSIYDGPGALVMLDVNDTRVTFVASGSVGDFDVESLKSKHPSVGNSHYNIKYTGKVYIEKQGSYTFYTNSDDGSQLYIDNSLLVDNNGAHSVQERSGARVLTEGFHDIEVRYFNNFAPTLLEVKYESSANGIVKQNIPFTLFTNVTPVYDTDGDGIENRLDLDSDNDGISDLEESGNSVTDANNDGMVDGPVGTDGVPDDAQAGNVDGGVVPSAVDSDGDKVKDVFDLDSDNDGIPDVVEHGNNLPDINNDGKVDGTIGLDGIANNAKIGNVETGQLKISIDFDNDGKKDFLDLDTDNDGISDIKESGTALTDTNNDGIIDGFTDANNDGLNDGAGIMYSPLNTDGDSNPKLPNFRDLDSDNDGINDIDEAQNITDTDGNGLKDSNLILISNPGNNYITVNGTVLTGADTDNDGILEPADELPNAYGDKQDRDRDGVEDRLDLDDDNDGILDALEDNFTTGSIEYEFYDDVNISSVDNIPTTGFLQAGTVTNFDVNALQNSVDAGDTDDFAIRYKAKIFIENPGLYTFYTSSDDGSKLFINGNQIVDNDNDHGVRERSGTVTLSYGYHELTVLYYENAFGASLNVLYQGPSISKQNIPFSILTTSTAVKEDKDNDGIINSLDTDSDGDGCPDAVEGGGNFTKYNLDANNRLTGGVDANGVPVLATASGQSLGDSNNASAQSASCSTGTAMISQVYQTISGGKAIEITNIGPGEIPANAIKVALFANTNDASGKVPTATYTYPTPLANGTSFIIKSGALTGVNTANSPVDITNLSVTAIADADDIIVVTNALNNTAWNSRIDVVTSIEDESSLVRIDETTTPNVNYTEEEWVTFVSDAITSYTSSTDSPEERHDVAPLLSEVKTANLNANIRLGIHKTNVTTRSGDNWSNGFPDRSRSVIIDENYNSTEKVSARKLTINANNTLSVTNNLLVVSNEINLNGDIRLVNQSQLVQTNSGSSNNTGTGHLLVDQNSTLESKFRYNYMGSPVNSGVGTYTVQDVLKDGTNPLSSNGVIGNGATNIAKNINFINGYDGVNSAPISIADYWIYTYGATSNWKQEKKSGVISQTDGFIMKGPGIAQNYTFKGIPKNGELTTSVTAEKDYLVANPYASALSTKKFIQDNINSTTGTLYFWEHAGEKNSSGSKGHIKKGYIGGYATLNLSGSVAANDVSLVGPVLVNLEAESVLGVQTNAIYEKEGSINSVKLDANGKFITFNKIQRSVDTIRVTYKAPTGKTLQLKLSGSSLATTTSYNLPASSTYTTFNIIKCFKIGTNIRLESTDTNSIFIDKITLKDNDGVVSCMPSTAIGGYTYKEPQSFIPIAQGFFVQGSTSGGNIIFNNSQRTFEKEGVNSVFYRSGATSSKRKQRDVLPFLQLGLDFKSSLDNEYYHRQIGISFNAVNSFRYDKGYDSETLDLGKTDMYWNFANDKGKYVIAGVQEISEDLEVPLAVVIDYSGDVVIGIDGLKNIQQPLFLKDALTGLFYDLRDAKATINLTKGSYKNRFFLTFKKQKALGVNPLNISNMNVMIFMNNSSKEVSITTKDASSLKSVKLYNILGQEVKTIIAKANQKSLYISLEDMSSSVYIVRVKTNKTIVSKKIIKE